MRRDMLSACVGSANAGMKSSMSESDVIVPYVGICDICDICECRLTGDGGACAMGAPSSCLDPPQSAQE